MPRIFSGKVILCLLFLLVLDISLAPFLRVGAFQPIFIYLAVVYSVFEWPVLKSIQLAVTVGFLRDLLGVQPFGVEACMLGLLALGLAVFVNRIEKQSLLMRFIGSFLFVFFALISILMLSGLLGAPVEISSQTMGLSFYSAASTAFMMPVIFYFMARWFGQREFLKQYELFG